MAANGPDSRSPCWRARCTSSSTGSNASRTPADRVLTGHVAVPLDPPAVVHVLGLEPLQVGETLFGERPRRLELGGAIGGGAQSLVRTRRRLPGRVSAAGVGVGGVRAVRAGRLGRGGADLTGLGIQPPAVPDDGTCGGLAVRGRSDSRFGHHLSSSTISASTTSSSGCSGPGAAGSAGAVRAASGVAAGAGGLLGVEGRAEVLAGLRECLVLGLHLGDVRALERLLEVGDRRR